MRAMLIIERPPMDQRWRVNDWTEFKKVDVTYVPLPYQANGDIPDDAVHDAPSHGVFATVVHGR